MDPLYFRWLDSFNNCGCSEDGILEHLPHCSHNLPEFCPAKLWVGKTLKGNIVPEPYPYFRCTGTL